jgi:hypothetical protein
VLLILQWDLVVVVVGALPMERKHVCMCMGSGGG